MGWAGSGEGVAAGLLLGCTAPRWCLPAPSHLQTRQQALTISAASPLFKLGLLLCIFEPQEEDLSLHWKKPPNHMLSLQSLPRYSPQCVWWKTRTRLHDSALKIVRGFLMLQNKGGTGTFCPWPTEICSLVLSSVSSLSTSGPRCGPRHSYPSKIRSSWTQGPSISTHWPWQAALSLALNLEHSAWGPPCLFPPQPGTRPRGAPRFALWMSLHWSVSSIKLEAPCELGIDTIQVPVLLPHPALVT